MEILSGLSEVRACTRTCAHILENDRARGKRETAEERGGGGKGNASLEFPTVTTIDPSRVGRVHARAGSVDKEIGSRYKFGDTCIESERAREWEKEARERQRRNYKDRG